MSKHSDFIKNSIPDALIKIPIKSMPFSIFDNVIKLDNINVKDGGNFRCDYFTNTHNGKHILFMGDSFAAGDGLEKEDLWCYKTFKKIQSKEKVSGYFNIGASGLSNIESIFLFFHYCKNFGNPEVVFFITTEYDRELRNTQYESNDYMLQNIYMIFEKYCKEANIKLFSFSWLNFLNINVYDHIEYDKNKYVNLKPLYKHLKNNKSPLSIFSTFYEYDTINDMMKNVWKYDKQNKEKETSLLADDLLHAGSSFHDFWADFIYDKYEKNMIK